MNGTSVITTSRLVLRPARLNDAPALYAAYTADPRVTAFLPWAPHANVEETVAFLASCVAKWQTREAFAWAICRISLDEPIGMIELRPADGSIGYVLAHRWWNQGIMSEALPALVHHARTALGISAVRAWCDAENYGSARVLEKSGFRLERTGPEPTPESGYTGERRPALFYVFEE